MRGILCTFFTALRHDCPIPLLHGCNAFISPMKTTLQALHGSALFATVDLLQCGNLPMINQIKRYRVKVVLYH
jgi:hypothetical protein